MKLNKRKVLKTDIRNCAIKKHRKTKRDDRDRNLVKCKNIFALSGEQVIENYESQVQLKKNLKNFDKKCSYNFLNDGNESTCKDILAGYFEQNVINFDSQAQENHKTLVEQPKHSSTDDKNEITFEKCNETKNEQITNCESKIRLNKKFKKRNKRSSSIICNQEDIINNGKCNSDFNDQQYCNASDAAVNVNIDSSDNSRKRNTRMTKQNCNIENESEEHINGTKSILKRSKKNKAQTSKSVSFTGVQDPIEENVSTVKNRLRNRKYKKQKKVNKQKMSKDKNGDKSYPENTNSSGECINRCQRALLYLNTWKYDKTHWKFEKLTQAWILKHMFNNNDIPDDSFQALLEYMMNMKGLSKSLAVDYCQNIIHKKEVEKPGNNVSNDEIKSDDIPYQRARSILQHLS